MSDVTIENGEQAEVPDYPLIPCRTFVCHVSGRVYPTYVTGTNFVYRLDEQSGRWGYAHVVTSVPNFIQYRLPYPDTGSVRVARESCEDTCDWCNEPLWIGALDSYDLRRMENMGCYICPTCMQDAYVCEACNVIIHCDNSYTFDDGDTQYCEPCYYDCTTSCDYCDTRYHVDDEPTCDCSSDMIQPYSTKFNPLMMRRVADNSLVVERPRYIPARHVNDIFLGLEFEMENRGNSSTREVAELFRDAYEDSVLMLKHDGSISDGFELVTQPHTVDAFMSHFPWDLIREAQSMGMRGWDVGHREIGIHIHINRKAFYTKPEHNRYNASPHLMAFMHFIYKNVPSIKRIAGRNVHYGHMDASYTDDAYGICRYGRSQSYRTRGINVQNEETVELRMFRSTMRVERVQAYLQFAEAAVRYTQTERVSKMRDRWNFRQFATWCSFQSRYEQLNNLIVETNAVQYAAPLAINNDDYDAEFVRSEEDINN